MAWRAVCASPPKVDAASASAMRARAGAGAEAAALAACEQGAQGAALALFSASATAHGPGGRRRALSGAGLARNDRAVEERGCGCAVLTWQMLDRDDAP